MTNHSRRDFLRYAAATTAAGLSPAVSLGGCNARLQDPQAFLDASARGDLAAVKSMLGQDASLLAVLDDQERSAYALALLGGHVQVAKFLEESGYTADLHEAALAQDWERFEELTADLDPELVKTINSHHPLGGTAMYAAAKSGAGSDMWRVYAVCGDPNAVPEQRAGVSPLQAALRYEDLPTAEITAATLLSNTADPNPAPNAERPPLHIAAERGSIEMVEMLIRVGARIDAQDQDGKSALQVARAAGLGDVARLLAEHESIPRSHRVHDALVDAEGNKYVAPDISSISLVRRRQLVGQSHGNLQFVTDALQKEPRLAHSVATTSEICVEAGAHMGNKAIVDVLLRHGAPYSLPTAVMMGDLTSVKAFLAANPERINERGAHDFALLWSPIIGRCGTEMMQTLLDHGANVEHQHFLGTTALHWACVRGQIEMVELLISHGANVNRVARKFIAEGETPLQMTRDSKIADLLKSHGAK